jgi:hypothetical protein
VYGIKNTRKKPREREREKIRFSQDRQNKLLANEKPKGRSKGKAPG